MSLEILISDIEAYGSDTSKLPARSQALLAEYGDHPEVLEAIEDMAELEEMLSEWGESEDGAEYEDESVSSGGADKGEEQASSGPIADGVPQEEVPFAFANLDDMTDLTADLTAALTALAVDELSTQPYKVFTRDHDAIMHVPVDVDADPSKIEERIGNQTRTMAKEMQRLIAARSLSVNQNGLRRGKINASALHRLSVNDDRVFRKRVEGQTLDVAVTLLLDQSGSMSGTKNAVAVQSAYAFADVLDRLGVKNEVIGFTTHSDFLWTKGGKTFPSAYGRGGTEGYERAKAFADQMGVSMGYIRWEPLLMPLVKTFNERFDTTARKRLATMHSVGWDDYLTENIDGECLRIAAHRLKAQKASRHIMMVFSDGAPASRLNRDILTRDLKEAVKEVTTSGVDLIGVGIRDRNASLFYPKSVTVNDISQLSGVVMTELKKVLV